MIQPEQLLNRPKVHLQTRDIEKITEQWAEKLRNERIQVNHRDKKLVRYLLADMDNYGHVLATLDDLKTRVGVPITSIRKTLNALEKQELIFRKSGIIIVNTNEIPRIPPIGRNSHTYGRKR